MKLDFIVVGAAKSGTTALHQTLNQINQLSLFKAKDIHFFDHDEVFVKGQDWYWSQFDNKASTGILNETLYGEVSANYLYSEQALKRIQSFASSSVKIIVLLRDPLQRLISEYKHHHRNGLLKENLHYYLENPDAKPEGTRYRPWHLLVERSLYSTYVEKLYQHFPKDRLQIINANFFKQQPQQCINELSQFIGIKAITIQPVVANKAFSPRSTQVMSLITNRSLLTRILRRLIPSFKLRQKIRDFATKLNTANHNDSMVSEQEIKQAKKILEKLGAFEFKF